MQLRSLKVLYWLSDQSVGQEKQVPEDICPERYLPGVYRELKEAGLIATDDRMAGAPGFAVLPHALGKVEELAGLYRHEAIKRAVLEEVRDNPDSGATVEYGEQMHVLGGKVTEAELSSAVRSLHRDDLIQGTLTLQLEEHLLRSKLTVQGESALRTTNVSIEGSAPIGEGSGRTTNNNNINIHNSTVGAVSAGDRNSVYVSQQGVHPDEMAALLSDLKSAIASLDLAEAEEAKYLGQVELIEDEFEDERDVERAQKGLKRFFTKSLPPALLANLGQLLPTIATIATG